MAKAAMEIRGEIVKDSPDRVRPIKLCFPVFRDGPYKAWHLDLAFRILRRFGPKAVPLNYKRVAGQKAKTLPLVNQLRDPEQLHSVAIFTEYMFDWPERLCIDAVLDAERMGAVVRNHTAAQLIERNSKGRWVVHLSDQLAKDRTAAVTARIVLNMAGIWIDQINDVQDAQPERLVFGTKGAHIVVQLPSEFRDYGIATTNSIGEPHYCLPSQGGYHHIGPTETVYEGDIDNITVNNADLSFLLRETNAVLPGLNLTEEDVVYSWAGVRPLTNDPAYPKGARARKIHDLGVEGLPGVYALTAGPIMTHRSAGRDMTAIIQNAVQPSGVERRLDYTPRRFPDNQNSPPLLARDPQIKLADLVYAAASEHAANLADILFARTGVGYVHQLTDDDARRAAEAVAVQMDWDEDAINRQVADFRSRIEHLYQHR